jgi:glutaredoxin
VSRPENEPRRGTRLGGTGPAPRVLVLGRPGCHLCEDAELIVDQVCRDLGVSWQRRDITDDPELHRRYAEQIPVTFVDGRQHDYWRVDPARLRAALGR